MPAATPVSARWASPPVRGSREQPGALNQSTAPQGHGFSAGPDPGSGHSRGAGCRDADISISSTHPSAHSAHGGPTGFLAAAQRCPAARAQAAGTPDSSSDRTKIRSHTAQSPAQTVAAGHSADPLRAFSAKRTGGARSSIHNAPDACSGSTCLCRSGRARFTATPSRPSGGIPPQYPCLCP